jgi:hypothetical protein
MIMGGVLLLKHDMTIFLASNLGFIYTRDFTVRFSFAFIAICEVTYASVNTSDSDVCTYVDFQRLE